MKRRGFSKRGGFIVGGAISLALLIAAGCSSPVPRPVSDDSAALGITVENRWAEPGHPAEFPDTVYFVRLQGKEQLAAQRELIRSNFRKGNRVYLLNAKPGRYVAVAASETVVREATRRDSDVLRGLDTYRVFTSYFDAPLIQGTEVEVGPGDFAVAGHFVVRIADDIEDGDESQRHFHRLVDPLLVDPFGNPIVDPDNSVAIRGKLIESRREQASEREFLLMALQDLKGSGWSQPLQRRLETLKN
jgi:hypothetical protein